MVSIVSYPQPQSGLRWFKNGGAFVLLLLNLAACPPLARSADLPQPEYYRWGAQLQVAAAAAEAQQAVKRQRLAEQGEVARLFSRSVSFVSAASTEASPSGHDADDRGDGATSSYK